MAEKDFSYATLSHLPDIERLHQLYTQDPHSVEPSWRYFFDGMALAEREVPQMAATGGDLRVYQLIEAYRNWGHLKVRCNPISVEPPETPSLLQPAAWGFKPEELTSPVPTLGLMKQTTAPLQELIQTLESIYCSTIGVEYTYITDEKLKKTIQQHFESGTPASASNRDEKIAALNQLSQAELFEVFLHTKYVGQKRFSLEGMETLIPLLWMLIETGASHGVQEVVIGMSHRGRLNVLANILGKSYGQIFHEFEDHYTPSMVEGTGDVKYHKGFQGKLTLPSGQEIPVLLAANPSHLESVDPVAEGITRAKQEKSRDSKHVVPILIHGDAAIAGQGVVYETLQLSRLPGYATGGTLHLILNNQIGFTTSPAEGRSTRYCSDIAKTFNAPVFHVNAEDPISCLRAARIASQIRQTFGCDVFIDLNGYRKYGHNEGDEPLFTQPLEYARIRAKPSIYTLLCDQLIKEGVISTQEAEERQTRFKEHLHSQLEQIPSLEAAPPEEPIAPSSAHLSTAVDATQLRSLVERLCRVPDGMRIHPKVERLLHERQEKLSSSIDWGLAEHLAFASLLEEKISIRLSGQDVGRGTFSHRHALIVDQVTGKPYFPLAHLSPTQGHFSAYNSPLSEYAVLGFDFGYSLTDPSTLVIWEAQFGDFANTAQVPIDQYIASSEQKWGQKTRLTLLLPHGYEGQGPEHSSARMERFLQLAAQDNLRIVNCSTPAQLFHILREQAHFPVQKPLVLFTPKALLRHPACHSSADELSSGAFHEILTDTTTDTEAKKLLLCSGKVYYDLIQEREKNRAFHVHIVRIEQLYPFPEKSFLALLDRYTQLQEICWVQEEPCNMGAWSFIRSFLNPLLGAQEPVRYIGRERSASPAAGSYAVHKKQLTSLLETAFT